MPMVVSFKSTIPDKLVTLLPALVFMVQQAKSTHATDNMGTLVWETLNLEF